MGQNKEEINMIFIQEIIKEYEKTHFLNFQQQIKGRKKYKEKSQSIAFILEDFFYDLGINLEEKIYKKLLGIFDSYCASLVFYNMDIKKFNYSKDNTAIHFQKAIESLKNLLGEPKDSINILDYKNNKPNKNQTLHIVNFSVEDYQTTLEFLTSAIKLTKNKKPKKTTLSFLIMDIKDCLNINNIHFEEKAINNFITAISNCKSLFLKKRQ